MIFLENFSQPEIETKNINFTFPVFSGMFRVAQTKVNTSSHDCLISRARQLLAHNELVDVSHENSWQRTKILV